MNERKERCALVLAGGGARGAYQVGVLREIARHYPDHRFDILAGVSAGSINTTFLAGYPGNLEDALETLCGHWGSLTTSCILNTDPLSMFGNALKVFLSLVSGGTRLSPQPKGLVGTKPLRRFLEEVLDIEGIGHNIRSGRLHAVAATTTSYRTGQTVTFVQGNQDIEMWTRVRRLSVRGDIRVEHVMGSTAIPLFFPAREIDGEYYGDGSMRQSHPLAPAVHLGATRILAVSSRFHSSGRQKNLPVVEGYPPAARILGLLMNAIFLDNLDVDAERLQRINHLVSRVSPQKRWLLSQQEVGLLVLRPSRDIGRMAMEYESDMPRSLRWLVRGLGSRRLASSDLVSYLLFESNFLQALIRLGEQDARRNWFRIKRFLCWDEDRQVDSAV
jgi:NTE family protein